MLKVHIKEFMYSKPRTSGNLRLSAIGKPDRQLWYDVNTETTEEKLPPSTRIKFLYGYILEELLLLCASIAGHTVEDQQKEVTVEGVLGHQDAVIDGVLVDCKSASGFSFKKFESNSMQVPELSTLRKLLREMVYLLSAMLLFLMGSLVTLSLLLVVCIVDTRVCVGLMLIKVKGYVLLSIQTVHESWLKLLRRLTLKK
jgi:hypothetical protein